MTKFESDIKHIPYSQDRVFDKLSNLNNLEGIVERIPQDKVQNLCFDNDSISFSVSPIGDIKLQVVEREPSKCMKLESVVSPMPFSLWIQLVVVTESECKIKVTIGMDINPFMKTMVQKPLKEGLEKMVEMLSLIKY